MADERTVIAWDSVVRPRTELNRDLDLAEAFRLSALPHFQSLARAAGPDQMTHFVYLFDYGNRDVSGGADRCWVAGGLRIFPREQLEFLIRLYTDDLPLSPTTMATVRRVMRREKWQGGALSAKTGWARLPGGYEVGWWVGWVEKGSDVFFFASMIEGDRPGADFGPARTEWHRMLLRWFQEGATGGQPALPAPGYKWNETPRLNRDIREKHREREFAVVDAEFEATYQEILELLTRLPEAAIFEAGHYQWTGKNALVTYVGANTASHTGRVSSGRAARARRVK